MLLDIVISHALFMAWYYRILSLHTLLFTTYKDMEMAYFLIYVATLQQEVLPGRRTELEFIFI